MQRVTVCTPTPVGKVLADPLETHTRGHGYGFPQVRVRVQSLQTRQKLIPVAMGMGFRG